MGVQLDPELLWDAHVGSVTARLAKSLFVMRSLLGSVSLNTLRTAYFSLFHSTMAYAILAWGHAAQSKRVFGLQRRAIRLMCGLGYRDDCRDGFASLGILTFPSVYILECLLYLKKNEQQYKSNGDVHFYHTRYRDDLVTGYCRLRRCQDGPRSLAIKFFNRLPNNVRSLPLKRFKTRVREFLIENSFYSFDEYFNCEFF